KQQAPHFYLTVDCKIDTLLAARAALNAKAPDGVKISVNDMIIRAAAMALMAVPAANASWEGEHTRRYHHADIAMAVAIDGGLITPIIWAAEQKGLAALSMVTSDLAARARDGALAPDEYTGGSFTISNLGMYGVREFAAVINPPHGAILAVGAGEQRCASGYLRQGRCRPADDHLPAQWPAPPVRYKLTLVRLVLPRHHAAKYGHKARYQ
ncbi:MAG: hypothetical protein EBV87_03555, partial [Alphaproteobacteria bacterium]|nr:hypothetical protein [Alphaproteobacteria bacterium]